MPPFLQMTLKRMTHRNYRTLGRCVINPLRFGVGAFLRHPPGEKKSGKKAPGGGRRSVFWSEKYEYERGVCRECNHPPCDCVNCYSFLRSINIISLGEHCWGSFQRIGAQLKHYSPGTWSGECPSKREVVCKEGGGASSVHLQIADFHHPFHRWRTITIIINNPISSTGWSCMSNPSAGDVCPVKWHSPSRATPHLPTR